eukprot:TRINITY_DN66488_c0_g1_i1.p1 TRINITY_DN66488_c0_g1~~TRINITY_DN66488_c0_g1_i1.p1  ORF type:complete len:291 (+),score=48.03 TRINITY_DN66488_c0_g1_i1:58-930(+)
MEAAGDVYRSPPWPPGLWHDFLRVAAEDGVSATDLTRFSLEDLELAADDFLERDCCSALSVFQKGKLKADLRQWHVSIGEAPAASSGKRAPRGVAARRPARQAGHKRKRRAPAGAAGADGQSSGGEQPAPSGGSSGGSGPPPTEDATRRWRELAQIIEFPIWDNELEDLRRLVAYEGLLAAARGMPFPISSLEGGVASCLRDMSREKPSSRLCAERYKDSQKHFPSTLPGALEAVEPGRYDSLYAFVVEEVPFIEGSEEALYLRLKSGGSLRTMSIFEYLGVPEDPLGQG